VHTTAARGFKDGDLYERGRPDYPTETITALRINAGSVVADLGCGTGKFTRMVSASGAHVVGVEPLPAMLATFRPRNPRTPVVAGTAEHIPLKEASFDCVVCASAFHWFRHDLALPEIHRVLKTRGLLGIVWNRRDKLEGWAADFWQITEAHRQDTPGYRTGEWREALERSTLFGPIEEHWFDNVQRAGVDGVLARVGSISFIETLPADERRRVMEHARDFLEWHPDTRGRDVLELPYRTVVYAAQRED
jgi:SAM-dependent methyltransferase